MAKIISLVGTSGSGKSTVQKNLAKLIETCGQKVEQVIEPGPFREHVLDYHRRRDRNHRVESMLYSASRFVLYTEKILPRIDEERLIFLSDRGLPATLVYQGIIGGVPLDEIMEQNSEIPFADLYLCLVVKGKVGFERALSRYESGGEPLMESENPRNIDRIAEAYRSLEGEPILLPNYHIIDTSKLSEGQTLSACWDLVSKIL